MLFCASRGFVGPGLATLRLDYDGGGADDDDGSDDVVRREMQQETIDWDDRAVEFAKDRRGLSEVTDWVTVEATGDRGKPARRSGTRHQGGRDACGTMASQKDSGGIGGWLVEAWYGDLDGCFALLSWRCEGRS